MTRIATGLAATLAVMASGPALGGDQAVAAQAARMCAPCHGANGNSTNPVWPKLAGQHQAYLAAQLEAFRSGARRSPLMSPLAARLDAEQIERLAAFFAAQQQR